MKVAKWICRYAFFALLLGGAVAWCVYCQSEVNDLENLSNSAEFIDTALESFNEATRILDRIDYFKGLRNNGIIVAAIIAGALVLLILWNIFGNKLTQKLKSKSKTEKPKKEKKPRPEKVKRPATVSAQTAARSQNNRTPSSTPAKPVTSAQGGAEQNAGSAQESAPAKRSGYCPQCGQYYEELPAFCAVCGAKINK